jgi:uncharacterized protein DUF1963
MCAASVTQISDNPRSNLLCCFRIMRASRAMAKGQASLTRLARRELPPAVADLWVGLLRPSLHLRAADKDEPLVGQLGGVPVLPDGVAWPHWDDYGPLTFIAGIDCGRLPSDMLSMPRAGTLSFFCAGGQFDGAMIRRDPPTVRGDAENRDLARVVYIPQGMPVTERDAPAGVEPHDLVELTGELFTTGPGFGWPRFREIDCRSGGRCPRVRKRSVESLRIP